MSSSVLSRHMERNAWTRVELDGYVDAAVNRAVLGLSDARPEHRWRIDGAPYKFRFDEADIGRLTIDNPRRMLTGE